VDQLGYFNLQIWDAERGLGRKQGRLSRRSIVAPHGFASFRRPLKRWRVRCSVKL
jgi:hypothetical protein